MVRALGRYAYALVVVALIGFIGVAGAFVLLVALPDLQRTSAQPPDPSATPVPSTPTSGMHLVQMPDTADCSACHTTDQGIGVKAIPAMAHPLTGWTRCTACHNDDRLVKTAPGHSGIHATDCLLCHAPQSNASVPLSRPHRELQNQDCLSCHGSTAPLPADMSHRTQTVCWLCHRLPQVEPPLADHPVSPGQKDCLTCHVAGQEGALPDDHLTRTPAECLLCHEPRDMASPAPLPSSAVSYLPSVPIVATGWWADVPASP